MKAEDPVFQDVDGWYFWDETWSQKHGPFESREKANIELAKYAMWLEHGDESDKNNLT